MTRDDIKYANPAILAELGEKLGVPVEASYGRSDEWLRAELLAVFDLRDGGGPAFGEFTQAGNCSIKSGGVSVRDYFAAKAMQGAMAEFSKMPIDEAEQKMGYLAAMSYAVADAMLRERAK